MLRMTLELQKIPLLSNKMAVPTSASTSLHSTHASPSSGQPRLSTTECVTPVMSAEKMKTCFPQRRHCPTPGCDGKGHTKDGLTKHYTSTGCPLAITRRKSTEASEPCSSQSPNGRACFRSCKSTALSKLQSLLLSSENSSDEDGESVTLDSEQAIQPSSPSVPNMLSPMKRHKQKRKHLPSSTRSSSDEEEGESQNCKPSPPPTKLRRETGTCESSSLLFTNVTREFPNATCKKCSKLYVDPRILPCLHSFCKTCIRLLVIQDDSQKMIRCSSCGATIPVPEKGVDVIPQNARLRHEAEIAMCEAKIKKEAPSECGECCRVPALPTVSFCCTCCMFLCQPCHEHHCISRKSMNHKILNLKDARYRDISEELKQHIPAQPLHCQEHADTEVKFYCTNCSSLVCIQCTVIQHAGHKFEEIKNYAQKQKDDLNHSAQSMPDAITKLNKAIVNGKAMTEKVGKRKVAVNNTIQSAFQELRKALDDREKALLAQSSEIATSKLNHLQIQMQEMVSLRDKMISCCEVISEAQKSHTDTQLLSVVMVLQTRLQEVMKKFTAMTPQLREDDTIATVLDTTTLVSEISTFGSIRKRRDYKSLSKPVMTISGVNAPYFVAVHDSGDIFVTSCSYHCIRVFDKNGTRKAIIGSQGNGVGQFSSPLGITISGDVMFVAENGGNRIQKLSVTGKFLLKFGTHGSSSGQMSSPWGMCLSSNGNLYITDYTNSRIQVFNSNGIFSHIINGPELRGPEAIAFDPCGNLHVADYSSKCVNVFTVDGNYIRRYGSGLLQGPAGIAVDHDGYCLVGDWNRKSLCIFDPQGNFVHFVPTAGSICGIALDKEGFVYVVDYGSNCVYKY